MFAGWLVGAILILIEWVKCIRAANRIRRAAKSEGKDWPFTKQPKFMVQFVYMPESLLDDTDGARTRAAKLDLLRLRKRMWKIVGLGIGFLVLGFCAAIISEMLK
jgi:hypothetical protein